MLRKSRQGGYLLTRGAEGQAVEADTFTCRHCNQVVAIPPGSDPASIGRWCSTCDGLLCSRCSSHVGCMQIEKRLAVMERRAELSKAIIG